MKTKMFFILLLMAIASCTNQEANKFKLYMTNGEQLYVRHCANCHQPDGTGLGKLIPPINNKFPKNNLPLTICSIKHGLDSPLTIDGITYQGKMPGNPTLSSLEIAEIVTYITNTWGNVNDRSTPQQVDSILTKCTISF